MGKLSATVGDLFDGTFRSLPEIRITGVPGDGLVAIYKLLQSLGAAPPGMVWSVARTQMVRADASDQPAAQLAKGQVDPFHVPMRRAVVAGETLPDLGLFFMRDELSIDYRMGAAWTPGRIDALFELLHRLMALAPGAKISLEPGLAPAIVTRFQNAWLDFESTRKPDAAAQSAAPN
jgi:hypothetical protein